MKRNRTPKGPFYASQARDGSFFVHNGDDPGDPAQQVVVAERIPTRELAELIVAALNAPPSGAAGSRRVHLMDPCAGYGANAPDSLLCPVTDSEAEVRLGVRHAARLVGGSCSRCGEVLVPGMEVGR